MDEGERLNGDGRPEGGEPPAERAYVALGSNLGDRESYLNAAIRKIREIPGVRITKVSSFYETQPVGGPPQGTYLNGVIELECSLAAGELLAQLQRIEKELGRTRVGKSFPRTIDLDILLYGERIIDDEGLNVPHPRMHERAFVLDPLNEIAPQAVHPRCGSTVAELQRSIRRTPDPEGR
jgi:2-amino-4-hydroxy-6-hydroxymethyldihydropteridine diphosphokinase